jgi:hypothetical protein
LHKKDMRRTKEEMREVYSQWEQSGLSRQDFCRRENIPTATFQYWQKRFNNESKEIGFTEVRLGPSLGFSTELVFPSGVRIVFGSLPSVGWLKELLG